MSILIKGMEMPTNCFDCKMRMAIGCIGVLQYQNTRMPNGPLHELPPHGRLIDADALHIDLIDRGIADIQTSDWYEIRQAVDDAPTIIEADTRNNSKETCNKAEDDKVNASIEVEDG